jgi:glycosyltransferase involved in cell wall biosynthesis
MKVAFDLRFVHKDHPSGLYTYALELARGLGRVAPDMELGLVVPPGFADDSVKGERFTSGTGFLTLWQHLSFALHKPWGRWQPDIYHYAHFNAPPCGSAALIATIHDLYPLIPGYANALRKYYFKRAITSTLRRAASVVCISNYARGEVASTFPAYAGKLVTIGEAARSDLRVPSPQESDAFLKRYKLAPNYILYIGNAKPHKNLTRLLEAYAKLPHKLRDSHHLVLAGNADNFINAGMQTLAQRLGVESNLHLTGTVEDSELGALYHKARVYVQPSLLENFGLPVADAQALGVPCLISSAGGLPQTGGDAALMVNPLDVEVMSEHLRLLLSDNILRDSLISRGLALSRERTWDSVARRVVELYRQVAHSS